jgi:predicted RNA-binding Zn ribbon-like protein
MNMLDPGEYSGTYDASAGHLALDFTNTLSNRNREKPHEWLDSYGNLVSWGTLVGSLSGQVARRLLDESGRHPGRANQTLSRAIDLRETIYRVFSAVVAGASPQQVDIDNLNAYLSEALVHLRLVPTADAFTWDWDGAGETLERMLWPVARSAAELLTSEDLGRVGECHGEGCGWLFLDMSRNRSRRWCSMEECGNRAKAHRHYVRTHKT